MALVLFPLMEALTFVLPVAVMVVLDEQLKSVESHIQVCSLSFADQYFGQDVFVNS